MNPTYRHHCEHRDNPLSGFSGFHTAGNGKPRRKRCAYCRGNLITESGWWGVFEWKGDTSYRARDAERIFQSEKTADDYANENAHRHLVVRWIPE